MVAFISTPAPACEWHSEWDGCDRGCDHGYGMQAYDTYAPPIYVYHAAPQVYYAPPVYYAPAVNTYGIHHSNYAGPRYFGPASYHGVQPHRDAAGYDDPRKEYSNSGDYSARVATGVKARNHSRTAHNHSYRRPLPTDRQARPTGSVKLGQHVVGAGFGPTDRSAGYRR
jgi:hypothetical protein